MADVLKGIEDDVVFDHATCDALQTLCTTTAARITGQAGSRASAVTKGSTDFKGYFSGLFTDNASTARADAAELATALRDLADFAGQLQSSARTEQRRREVAREWKRDQDARSDFHKGWDDFWGSGEDPPVGPADAPQDFSASPPRTGVRTTPAPGHGGGGGGGTSSARPENLRSFASLSATLDGELAGKPASLRSALAEFAARCRWGTLDGDGVVRGFTTWLHDNDEDVAWARTVAAAFAAAGGDGAVSTVANSALLASLRSAGVSATRQDLTIDPPLAYGHPPTTGYSVDPVNTGTGNFLEREVDLTFSGAGSNLLWDRTYNSFDDRAGAFGPGWSSWAEAGLELDAEAARLRLPDGRVVVFPRLGDGWDRATGENMWLERTATGLVARTNDGTTVTCDPAGRLLAVGDGTGADVHLEREAGRLVRLRHARGRWLEVTWADDRVVRAATSDGRAVDYAYDELGRLTAASGPAGTRHYRWDDAGLVSAVVDADGVVEAENAYDAQRRVTSQRTPHGRVVRFVYLPGRVTVVSDEDGRRSNTWVHDARGRLVGVVDSDEQRQSTSYDTHGNPVIVTGRDGATTIHEYDARGRRTRTVEPDGADLTYGYDDRDRVTTVVAASGGVVEYVYGDEGRNPTTVVDPEGGRTELAWESGLLTRMVDPTGVALRFEYDAHGDLVATTDALGGTARVERDALGRVTASVTPGGARTAWTYTPGGQVASRRDPDGGVWRYEHTAGGRLVATVDPTGARTEVEHGAHGDATRTVDPLGRAVTRTLDDLGNVSAMQLPDGSTWHFTHDALSRLVATTDPTGAEWQREYDVEGRLTATLDPTGRRVGVTDDLRTGVTVEEPLGSVTWAFDELGRPTTRTGADGSTAMTVYDRCGRAVELLDAEGGLTRVARDAAGRVVALTSPAGATTTFEHDACGRRSAVIDAAGTRTSLERDADGRVVRTVLPTGEADRIQYDACGRVVARTTPGRGTARYRYDLAGRLVESSDTWYGHRRFRHDAAGQLVEVVNGNGGVTRYDYDANGRAVAVTDPLGRTTRREFDAMNRCVAETDPLGRTVRAGYDAAGRVTWQQDATGAVLTWTHDASGRVATQAVDGRVTSSVERDLRTRTVRVTDHTGPDGTPVEHVLTHDRAGRLVSRTRGDRTLSWTYDADGHRTARTTPDGRTTTWQLDPLGREVAVDHPLLGRAVVERDAAGRVVAASAGEHRATWEHHDGFVARHTVTGPAGTSTTLVRRDADGRVTAVETDGRATAYAHDPAGQLVEARLDGVVTRWSYDAAGQLVGESADGATRRHHHDAAGQLVATEEPDGTTTRHAYDAAGRRVRTEHADGRVRELAWTATGRLASITDLAAGTVHRTTLHVDATGELAEVDGTPLSWDTARGPAAPLVQVGDVPVLTTGPLTGVGSTWAAPGWRGARSTGDDPWAAGPGAAAAGLPDGLGVGGLGELLLGGGDPLEWLRARVYDPGSRGFLSVDPLDPVTGAGWAGNPYAYAGNDPLHLLDPTGQRPATDADLDAYKAAHNGWIKDHWEYVVGGLAVAGGIALIATGVGGPLGGMLISGGVDVIMQEAQGGKVDWVQSGLAFGLGAYGGAGAARAILSTRAATTALGNGARTMLAQRLVGSAVSGAVTSPVQTAYSFASTPGPHTAGEFVQQVAVGTGQNVVLGGLGHAVDASAVRYLPRTHLTPDVTPNHVGGAGDDLVLGSNPDVDVVRGAPGHTTPGTALDDRAVQQAIDYQRPVYLASEPGADISAPMHALQDAGYVRQGDYMVPTGHGAH